MKPTQLGVGDAEPRDDRGAQRGVGVVERQAQFGEADRSGGDGGVDCRGARSVAIRAHEGARLVERFDAFGAHQRLEQARSGRSAE